MNCEFKLISSNGKLGTFACVRCNQRQVENVPIDLPIHRLCKEGDGEPPKTTTKIKKWSSSITKWIKAGRPQRSDAEVTRIYNEICVPCQHFFQGSCELCGCRVNLGSISAFNKIRMATESCPIQKWKAEEEPS